MNNIKNQKNNRRLIGEELFRDELVNLLIIMWAVVYTTLIAIAQLRTIEIGWNVRDLIQVSFVAIIISITFFREKISTHKKGLLLIFLNLSLGFLGVVTLGVFAGGIFAFPMAAVIMALFYSTRVVSTLVLLSVICLFAIAAGFSHGQLHLNISADLLMTSYINWFIYMLCLVFLIVITCVTIIKYRQAMSMSLAKVSLHRDELDRTNKEL